MTSCGSSANLPSFVSACCLSLLVGIFSIQLLLLYFPTSGVNLTFFRGWELFLSSNFFGTGAKFLTGICTWLVNCCLFCTWLVNCLFCCGYLFVLFFSICCVDRNWGIAIVVDITFLHDFIGSFGGGFMLVGVGLMFQFFYRPKVCIQIHRNIWLMFQFLVTSNYRPYSRIQ